MTIFCFIYFYKSNLKPEDLTVRAGEWDLKVDQERNPHQDRKVVRMVKHEKYSKGSGWNDVGLVFLDEPFQLQLHINTVCLPPQDLTFDEENCKASGWGNNNGRYNNSAVKYLLRWTARNRSTCPYSLKIGELDFPQARIWDLVCVGWEGGSH